MHTSQLTTDQAKQAKQKNTFSTDSSKRDNQIETDQHFKLERQKYLQERKNHRKQVQNIRKQAFGSSSSESQKSVDKPKPKQIIKDYQLAKKHHKQQPKTKPQSKTEDEQFHAKHQAYIKEKLSRKQQMVEQRRKEFGTSSSDSDDQFAPKKQVKVINNRQTFKPQAEQQKLSIESSNKQKSSSHKKSFEAQNMQSSTKFPSRHHLQYKGEKQDVKKLTVLVQSKKNQQWVEQTMVIEKKRIKLINQNIELMIAYVTKIKLFFTKVQKDYLKMKITFKEDDYLFAISPSRKVDGVDEYYYVFSRVIQEKLMQIGFEPKKNEATIFPNYMNLKDAPVQLRNSAIVFGNVMKKSQVLGNWETRFVYITNKEIGSSKRPNDKPSMVIPAATITEIWSRFDIENNNMLTIKIMYNSGTKTEFSIPISNLTDQFNWLYSFYRIINQRE